MLKKKIFMAFFRSAEQNWFIGGNEDEVWNGWHHIQSEDNFWGCGNNIGMTLKKGFEPNIIPIHLIPSIVGDMTCTYRGSYYSPSFSLVKLNGKSASGNFSYDRSRTKAEVYEEFIEFIENQIAMENNNTKDQPITT